MINKATLVSCITIKRVCLVLGIISSIANLLLLMWYALVWFLALALGEPGVPSFGGYYHRDWIPEVFAYVVVPVAAVLNFIFTVLLCNGICASRPRQVKVYFVYGVIITAVATLAAVMLLSCDSEQLGLHRYLDPEADVAFNIRQGLWWLFGCVLHSLFLILVHRTHRKLQEDARAHLDNILLLERGNTKQRF